MAPRTTHPKPDDATKGDFNGADPAAFDHDGDGKPGGSKPRDAEAAEARAPDAPQEIAPAPEPEPEPEPEPQADPTAALSTLADEDEEDEEIVDLLDEQVDPPSPADNVDPPAPEEPVAEHPLPEGSGTDWQGLLTPLGRDVLRAMAASRYGLYRAKDGGFSTTPDVATWDDKTVLDLVDDGYAWFDKTGGQYGSVKALEHGREALKRAA